MKKVKVIGAVLLLAVLALPVISRAGVVGPVKISAMTRVESHTKVADNVGNYGGEAYIYNMISMTRQLDKDVIGSIFYLNQYSVDQSKMLTHIGGATVIRVFNSRLIGTLGYSFSSNPEKTDNLFVMPMENQDRFSTSLIYNLNPKSKGAKYSLLTGYSTETGWHRGRVLSEKLGAKFPIFNKKWVGDLNYTYVYGVDRDSNNSRAGQLTNQYSGNLTYQMTKQTKLVLGAIFINKLYGSAPDDTIFRLSALYNLK
jgi:hypothetical protein